MESNNQLSPSSFLISHFPISPFTILIRFFTNQLYLNIISFTCAFTRQDGSVIETLATTSQSSVSILTCNSPKYGVGGLINGKNGIENILVSFRLQTPTTDFQISPSNSNTNISLYDCSGQSTCQVFIFFFLLSFSLSPFPLFFLFLPFSNLKPFPFSSAIRLVIHNNLEEIQFVDGIIQDLNV